MEIYVHVPFCVRKCPYCDFYSGPGDEGTIREYFGRVKREIGECAFRDEPVESVFFGGGTPSLPDEREIAGILEKLRETFVFTDDPEITLEANPGTVTEEKLLIYREAGVNRLSIGLQSGDGETLKKLGRIHTVSDFRTAFEAARKAGFRNINIDLLSGLPDQTPDGFEKTLRFACSFGPEHLSVYDLIIEEGTVFHERFRKGLLKLPDEETDRAIYRRTKEILAEYGYSRYEISNYARPGFECRHNVGYWTGKTYLGFGPSAASFVRGMRFQNERDLHYDELPYIETEVLSEEDRMSEFMILGLRMTAGVSDEDFRKRFGISFYDRYREEIETALKEKTLEKKDGRLALTEFGLDVANRVMAAFIGDRE